MINILSSTSAQSFCKCRTDGKGDNDVTENCCNDGLPAMGVDYSLRYSKEHHRVCPIPLAASSVRLLIAFSAIATPTICTMSLYGRTVAVYLLIHTTVT